MRRWLLALPGALTVTILLGIAIGWTLGQAGQAAGSRLPAAPGAGVIGESGRRPQRIEIPVRHVYPVPVWDPGPAALDPAPGLSEIVAVAGPDVASRVTIRTSCTVRLLEVEGAVRAEPAGCSDPAEFAAVRALVEAGLDQRDAGAGPLRLVGLTARFERPAEGG